MEKLYYALVVTDPSGYSPYCVSINHAADHGAKVVNLNLPGSSYSSTLQNAVNYAWNKKIVAAVGQQPSTTLRKRIPTDAFYGAGNFLRH